MSEQQPNPDHQPHPPAHPPQPNDPGQQPGEQQPPPRPGQPNQDPGPEPAREAAATGTVHVIGPGEVVISGRADE